jgi:hypothetical protein
MQNWIGNYRRVLLRDKPMIFEMIELFNVSRSMGNLLAYSLA